VIGGDTFAAGATLREVTQFLVTMGIWDDGATEEAMIARYA
jgi:hypothetical protein